MNEQIIVFFDTLGRTIIGVTVGEDSTSIQVKNPAVLHAGVADGGKIQVNLIPAFFREFLKDWNGTLVFKYNKNNITLETNNNVLDEKLTAQYFSMWSVRPSREEARKNSRELTPSAPVEEVKKLDLFNTVADQKS